MTQANIANREREVDEVKEVKSVKSFQRVEKLNKKVLVYDDHHSRDIEEITIKGTCKDFSLIEECKCLKIETCSDLNHNATKKMGKDESGGQVKKLLKRQLSD